MNVVLDHACLAEIQDLWRTSPAELRPASFWVARHEAVDQNTDDPETPVERAWYFDSNGMHQRAAIDYVRFIAIHSGRAWASGSAVPPTLGVFNNRPGRTHTIGLAAFAPVRNSDLIYLHYQWGGTFGRGALYRAAPATGRLDCIRNIWIS